MLTPHDMLWGILFPAIVALVATIAGQLSVRRDSVTHAWGPAVAIAVGFAIAYVGIVGGVPKFPPPAAQGWLFHLAGVVVIVSIAASMTPARRRGVVGALLSIIVLASAAWLICGRARTLGPGEMRTWTIAATAGMVLWWTVMEGLARRERGATLPLLLSAAVGAAALTLVNAHTQALGQIAGGLAVALLIVAVLGLWFRNLSLAHGGVLAIAVALLGLILCGYFFADLLLRDVILLAAAPLALWVDQVPPLRRRAWTRLLVMAVLMLGILSVSLVPALRGLKQTMDEQTQSYQY